MFIRSDFTRSPWMRLFLLVQALLAVCLLTIAIGPQVAFATPIATIQADASLGEEEEGEEAEWESEEEAEEGEEEFEAGKTAGPAVLPPECGLSTVHSVIISDAKHKRLQLSLRYTAEEPTKVGVKYWLKGGKGSLQLGAAKRQLDRRGVLHLKSHLDAHELAKVRAARVFMVRIDIPEANAYCERFLTFRLAAKQQRASRTAWSELSGLP
jgi:hypothetical protein